MNQTTSSRAVLDRSTALIARYRWVFAALVGVAAYAIAGFWLAPKVIHGQAVAALERRLDRSVSLGRVRINPFALSVELSDLRIDEPDGTRLIGFERLYANLQLSSLFRWAWTLREFRLDVPDVELIREADGTLNLARLVPQAEAPGESDEPAAFPRIIVGDLVLAEGVVHVTDRTRDTDFETVVGPVNIDISDLSTLPDDEGNYQISVTTEYGSQLEWSGDLQVSPFLSTGRVTGSGPFSAILSRFLEDMVAFTLPDGRFELAFDYTFGTGEDGALFAAVDAAELELLGVTLQHDTGEAPFLALPNARIDGGTVRWPERSVAAARVDVTGATLSATRLASGELDLVGLLRSEPGRATRSADDDGDAEPLGGWSWSVDEIDIADLSARLDDRSLRSPATTAVDNVALTLRDVTSDAGARFPYDATAELAGGGRVVSEGTLGLLPAPSLDGSLTVTGVALAAAQPYVDEVARVLIENGSVDAELAVTKSPDELGHIEGSLTVSELGLRDEVLDERLVGWSSLDVNALTVDLGQRSVELSEVLLSGPYVRLLIEEDRSTNFGALLVDEASADAGAPPPTESEPAPAPDAAPTDDSAGAFELAIGRLEIVDGSSDFADRSLPLPFATRITGLAGDVTTFVTSSAAPAELSLEGQVEDYGLARIDGTVSPGGPSQSMDLDVLFRNVEMPDLSPYTARFAGRTIAEGRLDLDLHYTIANGMLMGENGIVIADLALGERIESPDAADLPLDLAVALLTGPDGRITVDLPVSGDLDNPQFDFGSIVMGAVRNLIAGIVTSPFRLLGRLIGAESEDLDVIEFEAGDAEITPPEREKLENLAAALMLRPELALVIGGVVAPEADTAALKTKRVDARIDAAAAAVAGDASLIVRRREAIEADFRAHLPAESLEAIQATFMRPADSSDPASSSTLDVSAYLAALRERLIEAEPIPSADLAALATARADAIRQNVTAAGIEPARIEIAQTDEVALNDAGWIPLELDVAEAG